MIQELSQALKLLLTQAGLGEVDIAFTRPVEDFKPDKPTIDLFLYDIRENLDLRSQEPTLERINGQVILRRPPLFVKCCYLVTVWSGKSSAEERVLEEHKLLSQVLQILAAHPTIPDDVLPNNLKGQEPPWEIATLLPDAQKHLSDFWSAIGIKLRPSFTVTASIHLPVWADITSPMVRTGIVKLGERTSPEEEKIKPETLQTLFHIRGQVVDATDQPKKEAEVTLTERNLSIKTDSNGQFNFNNLDSGSYTLQVRFDTTTQSFNITVPAPQDSNYDLKLT
jgi:Pvc16 N-terminal domain/Carboxypeptidase regulatory-like domain